MIHTLFTARVAQCRSRLALCAVAVMVAGGNVLVVNNNVPAKNLNGFIAWMKASPGKINAATGGYGSSPHIALAAFEQAAGVIFNTVHYKGGGRHGCNAVGITAGLRRRSGGRGASARKADAETGCAGRLNWVMPCRQEWLPPKIFSLYVSKARIHQGFSGTAPFPDLNENRHPALR